MKSTGEVMGIDARPGHGAREGARLDGRRAARRAGRCSCRVANRDKRAIVFPAKRLADLGFRLVATGGTAGVLRARRASRSSAVAKVSEGPHNVVDLIRGGTVDLVINTPFGRGPRTDGYFIRTAAAAAGVPCITTLPGRLRRGPGDRGAPRRAERAPRRSRSITRRRSGGAGAGAARRSTEAAARRVAGEAG